MGMNPESIPQVRGAEEPFLAELGAFFKRNTKSYGETNYKEYPGDYLLQIRRYSPRNNERRNTVNEITGN